MKINLEYGGVSFTIDVNENSYDLTKLGKNTLESSKNFGSITETGLGWFNSLGKCLDKIIRSGMANTEVTVSLKEYIKRYENVREELMKILG